MTLVESLLLNTPGLLHHGIKHHKKYLAAGKALYYGGSALIAYKMARAVARRHTMGAADRSRLHPSFTAEAVVRARRQHKKMKFRKTYSKGLIANSLRRWYKGKQEGVHLAREHFFRPDVHHGHCGIRKRFARKVLENRSSTYLKGHKSWHGPGYRRKHRPVIR